MTTTSAKQRPGTASKRAHWRRIVATSARWLHIYLSMVSFAVVLFFSATGLTLNHPDWFTGQQKTTILHGVAEKSLLRTQDADGANKAGLVQRLRSHDHVQGAVSDFRVDSSQVSLSFRAPGYTADAFIDRDSGKYDLTVVRNGFVAVVNDLHKGRDAGKSWSLLIDISAVLLVLVSVTGMVLMWFVYKRRRSGFVLAALATLALFVFWRLFVP